MASVQITPEEVNSLLSKAKNWITAHEAHVSSGRLPPGLTEDHINALRTLQVIRKPDVFESREPGLEGENWVGKLHEYHQKHTSDSPPPTFTEFTVMIANHLRFRCSVIISEHQHRAFPREEDYPNGAKEAPTFARKKDAKQWAAKCAIEWLNSRNRNKHELSPPSPRKEKSAKVQKIEQPEASHDSYRTTSPGDSLPGGPSSGPSPEFGPTFIPQAPVPSASVPLAPVPPAPVPPAPVPPASVPPAPVSPTFVPPAPVSSAFVSPEVVPPASKSPAPISPAPISPASISPMSISSAPVSPVLGHSVTISAGQQEQEKRPDTDTEPILAAQKMAQPPPKPNLGPTPPLSPSRAAGDDTPTDQAKTNSSSWWAQGATSTKGNPTTPTKKNHPGLNKSVSSPAVIDTTDIDREITPTRHVDIICKKLGLPPPRYCIYNMAGEGSSSNLFNGFASWPPEAGMPVRVGEVSEIYTKKGCKDLVAEKVLGTLKEVELERARITAQVLGEAAAA